MDPKQIDFAQGIKGKLPEIGKSVVIVCDVSSSMMGVPFARLQQALTSIWDDLQSASILAFSSFVYPIEHPSQLPTPNGGTALHWALAAAAVQKPSKVIVISDGEPDDQQAAFEAAEEIPGVIDAIFVGDESDKIAIEFMKKLSRMGGGTVILRNLRDAKQLLAPAIKSLLQLEGPIAL